MGEDNLKSFHKWKNYEVILENHAIYVYPRVDENGHSNSNGEKYGFKNNTKVHFIAAPIVEISATFIRNSIKNKKNIQPLLPNKVWEYIDHNNLYRK
jgi:nicotinate-nucleotide adenylyltransferase